MNLPTSIPEHPTPSSTTPVHKLARGSGINLIGKLTGRFLYVLSQVALARFYGPEAFGLYSIGWTLLRMTSVVIPLGLDHGVIRYGSIEYNNAPRLKGILLQSFFIAVTSGLIFGLIIYILSPWLANSVFKKPSLEGILQLFSASFFLVAGLRIATSATRVTQNMKYSIYADEVAQTSLNLILVIVFFLMGFSIIGGVLAATLSFLGALILALIFVKKLFSEALSHTHRADFMGRELFLFSLPASFAGIFSMFNLWIDRLLVGYFRSSAEVGIYQAASQTAIIFAIILGSFNAMFAPMIANLYHKKEYHQLEELFRVSTKWALYFCLPLALIIWFSSDELMAVIFGSSFQGGSQPLSILTIGQLINAGTGTVGTVLIMTGHQKRWFIISVLMLAMNVLLNSILIPKYGILGAATGTTVAFTGIYLFGLFSVKSLVNLWPYDKRYLKGLIAALITTLILFIITFTLSYSPLLKLFIVVAVTLTAYFTILIFQGFDIEDREVVALIKSSYKKIKSFVR